MRKVKHEFVSDGIRFITSCPSDMSFHEKVRECLSDLRSKILNILKLGPNQVPSKFFEGNCNDHRGFSIMIRCSQNISEQQISEIKAAILEMMGEATAKWKKSFNPRYSMSSVYNGNRGRYAYPVRH